jgi:hypothetical protein
MYHRTPATTFAQKKDQRYGLTTYIEYLDTIGDRHSIFGVHRAGSGEEKGNCQDLGLNIFPLCHYIPSYFPATVSEQQLS